MIRTVPSLGVGLALAVVSAGAAAEACDRAVTPFEQDLSVAVAVADVVFGAKVLSVAGTRRTVKVLEVFAGDGLTVGATLLLDGAATEGTTEHCGGRRFSVGDEALVLAWRPPSGSAAFTLVDPFGGLWPNTPEQRRALSSVRPAPMSPWSAGPKVQARAFRALGDEKELDLFVVVRNVGAAPLDFTYSDWPEATASTCRVELVPSGAKQPLPAKPAPIARADIVDFFSKNGRSYAVPLAPGSARLHLLQRVTTAAPGWGYKEALGFRYWPVPAPGLHAVTVECRNLTGHGSQLRAGPVAVTL